VRNVLLVKIAEIEGDALRERVRQHLGGEEARIRVVTPASKIGVLEWLSSDVDAARVEAGERAHEAADALGESPTKEVDAEVGDVDPVQAIEDALRTFPADELLLVTPTEDEKEWLEKGTSRAALERFTLPITQIVA
jgi:hypothetical protein